MPNSELRRRSVFSIGTAIALIGVLYISFQNLQAERRYANITYLARSIERGEPLRWQTIHDNVGMALSMVDAGECRSSLLSDGLTVVLADLDGRDPTSPEEERVGSLKSADRFITHVLGCTPTDGDAWARLAMIRQTLGEKPGNIAILLERSSWYAPVEASTLSARLEVWRHAKEDTLIAAGPALDHDILTVLAYFPFGAAAKAAAGGGQRFKDRVISVSSSLSDERIRGLRKAGLEIVPPRGEPGAAKEGR